MSSVVAFCLLTIAFLDIFILLFYHEKKNIQNTSPNLLGHCSFGPVLELHLLRGSWIAAWLLWQSFDYSECGASLVTPCCNPWRASCTSEFLCLDWPLQPRKCPCPLCAISAQSEAAKSQPEWCSCSLSLTSRIGERMERVKARNAIHWD